MKETEFIEAALAQYREALSQLPEQFAAAQRKADRQIDLLCEEAGIMGKVQAERDSLTNAQKQVQQTADLLSGRINMLEEIHKQFHLAPIPEGVTHMYGIELAPLDPDTRLKVMHGQEDPTWHEAITTLGGDPDFPDWDGTYEDEEDEEDDDPSEGDLPVEQVEATVQRMPPATDYAVFEGTDIIEAITGAGDPEVEPEDSDLDDIELAEIESRIEAGTATQEDMERVAGMLERVRQEVEE